MATTTTITPAGLDFVDADGIIEVYGDPDASMLCDYLGRINLYHGTFYNERTRREITVPASILNDEAACREFIAAAAQKG